MNFHAERLQALRHLLKTTHKCHGFIVPHADLYQGEYVADCDERLSWLTGFTGSAGTAIILADRAALFIDGRYTLQAQQQVDLRLFEIFLITDKTPQAYVAEYLNQDQCLGFDPWLMTLMDQKKWLQVLTDNQWQALSTNPIDELWQDQPCRPVGTVQIHPLDFAGINYESKIHNLQQKLQALKADALVMTTPDALCWLLNIRGHDFPHTPLVDATAVIEFNKPVALFINASKVSDKILEYFADQVIIKPFEQLVAYLQDLSPARIVIEPSVTPLAILAVIPKQHWVLAENPCTLAKAIKNPVEQAGTIAAHIRDGVALTSFLAWLDMQEEGSMTEMTVADQLAALRALQHDYKGPSFPTIAGFRENGAIVHYRARLETNKTIMQSGILLIDSGAQYLDGTTDVTRTIVIGEPTAEQKQRFTLVLKGHIAIAMVRFPVGTSGAQLDILARQPLWQYGLDFDHGTGHGVGSYLSVHEGPQRIGKAGSSVALHPGMILSNEPGYYKAGDYGIRIENLVMVEAIEGDFERPLLGFKTLTMAPISARLIDPDLLTAAEKDWLNSYHQTVQETLLPHLDPETATWLIEITQPLY